ncbi:conserved hypothetical protein [Gloeothece citriformis PCC 7424]|uniref:Uncharacterized protein n=1 Tax=Gloeothece citriformis (strain PCC 7424) TaxID=65393 RepID=B7KH13_GLOC7|nr:ElyC/SanA/YdcF family protein [Gloeothece citriformis]ACK73500.1 conserved hypothetical protein [Gloeothece citriformis PCC 7424]
MKYAPESFPKLQKLWGLVEYKPVWTLSLKGWLFIISILIILGIIFMRTIHPFLAMNNPIKAEVLVIEGWVGDIVIKEAITEFKQGNYQLIITTGSPLGRGSFLRDYKNYAELTAATLMALGIPKNKIIPIPTPVVNRDRTAASVEALKDWITQSNLNIKAVNIYTYDVHSRRSWFVYKKMLNPKIQVGAIAHPGDYNTQQWWTSSLGVKSVLSETIAYLYARFFWKNL